MINRLSAMLVAIGLLAGVIYLGILSGQDSKFVVWFGIASAIAAPIGLSLLAYARARAISGAADAHLNRSSQPLFARHHCCREKVSNADLSTA
ncbi:MAG TPA: hypothetical protein VH209_09775, partial [Steroidobacteraceae bacterium]|nr:hypothetical protein [Steroidobacteraceae bacterium]